MRDTGVAADHATHSPDDGRQRADVGAARERRVDREAGPDDERLGEHAFRTRTGDEDAPAARRFVPCDLREPFDRQTSGGRSGPRMDDRRFRPDRSDEFGRREFELLTFLGSSPRRVFTRVELLQFVWDASAEWLGTATVTEHIRRLRNRLRIASGVSDWIDTVRGVGYRFDPDAAGIEARAETGT